MLKQILHEIESASGPLDINTLSRRLGVDRTALEGMIQFWVQKGRLSDDAVRDSGAMVGCSSSSCVHDCASIDDCPFVLKMPKSYSLK